MVSHPRARGWYLAGQIILAGWFLTTFPVYVYEAIRVFWPRIVVFLEWTWRTLELLR